ncbi:MAG TPA: HAD family hydrolase, partial [Mycobacterium sp.]|nr:HAD family hydrolase [Mycobacterium sp.]
WAQPLVRQLVGDGLVETIVTGDDLPDTTADVRALALWEMGIGPEGALAIEGTAAGVRAARAAGLATVVVTTDYAAGQDFADVAEVRQSYDGADPLRAASCQRLHRQWWMDRAPAAA